MTASKFASSLSNRNRKYCVATDGDGDLPNMNPKEGIIYSYSEYCGFSLSFQVNAKIALSNRLRPENSGLFQSCAKSLCD
jgi:hypothetical protein